MLCLQETKHSTDFTTLRLDGFSSLFSAPWPNPGRQGRRGVAILARTAFLQLHRLRFQLVVAHAAPSYQLLAARLGRMLVISVYVFTDLPTGTSATSAHGDMIHYIQQLSILHPGLEPIVGGDFNWPALHPSLHLAFSAIGLRPLLPLGTPTRDDNMLDNIFSLPRLDPGTTKEVGSDHLAVVGSLAFLRPLAGPCPLRPRTIAYGRLRCPPRASASHRAAHAALVGRLRAVVAAIPRCASLDAYQEQLTAAAAATLGYSQRRPLYDFSPPWMRDFRVRHAWHHLRRSSRRYSSRRTVTHRHALNRARHQYSKACKAAIAAYLTSLHRKLNDGRIDPRIHLHGRRTKALPASDTGPLASGAAIAHWRTVFARNPHEPFTAIDELAPLTCDLSAITITLEQVQAAIASTQPRACGPDGLNILLLRACAADIAGPLAELFTGALRTDLPLLFQRGKTILLPKSTGVGQVLSPDPLAYRPITLLPALTRVLHKVVDSSLRRWLATHGGLSSIQAGFRPGRSTLEQPAILATLASLQQRVQRELYVAFLDITKAFDSISHAQLLVVLHQVIGIPLVWVEAIRRLLVGLTTTIFDEEIPVTRGTPQGSPLSPLLCLCFMEDLCRWIIARGPPLARGPFDEYYDFPSMPADKWARLVLRLFADDVAPLEVAPRLLQHLLHGVHEWAARRDLQISPKSVALVLASGPSPAPRPALSVGLPSPLRWVDSHRYLGVPFVTLTGSSASYPPRLDTDNLAYHLLEVSDLLTGPGGMRYTNPGVFTSMVHTLVLSRALYAAPIMPIATSLLDTRLNVAARSHFRLPHDYNTVLLRTELNLLPAAYLVCLRRLRFALCFFRCPFFVDFIAPALDHGTGGLSDRVRQVGVLPLLLDAFNMVATVVPGVPISLASVRAAAASDISSSAWARRTASLVLQRYVSDWPHVGLSSSPGPLPPAVAEHLRLVSRSPPIGTAAYVRLGGAYASIGLLFKGFSLRCSGSEGIPHHGRSSCLWCGAHNAECGIHLLVCSARPADRVDFILGRIFLESEGQPFSLPALHGLVWTRARWERTLAYAQRLEWPHMTRSAVVSTLREVGTLLNLYRHAWVGAPGAPNPIPRVLLPPQL